VREANPTELTETDATDAIDDREKTLWQANMQ